MGCRDSCSGNFSRFLPRTSEIPGSLAFPSLGLLPIACRWKLGVTVGVCTLMCPIHRSRFWVEKEESFPGAQTLWLWWKGEAGPGSPGSGPQSLKKIGVCRVTPCAPTDLVRVFQFGWGTVPEPLHGLHWGVAEVGWLPVHHLYHHDTQRPDIHLQEENVSDCTGQSLAPWQQHGPSFPW